jgi:glyoxylase-like metal-dependent hydrolase (beta-lactamase superfamily II)
MRGVVSGSRVSRILAPNPSAMTLEGTNTYLVAGAAKAIVIDPGPALEPHLDAIVERAKRLDVRIAAIVVTHGHPDHYPAAAPLRERTGAPVYAHCEARFPHDAELAGGERFAIDGIALEAVEAPGHARDHLVFAFEREETLFTGDVVVGRGTVVIAPPGGDMRAYQATLERLRREYGRYALLLGGHGDPVDRPAEKLDAYIAHRQLREREILQALGEGAHTIPAMVGRIYRDVPVALWPAAARQVLAHLIALEKEGRIRAHRLERAPAPFEREILNPDLSRVADPASAAVARAELGIAESVVTLDAYELAR